LILMDEMSKTSCHISAKHNSWKFLGATNSSRKRSE